MSSTHLFFLDMFKRMAAKIEVKSVRAYEDAVISLQFRDI